MKRTTNFTEGAIYKPLLGFAFPALLTLLLQTMYGAVDLMIVGLFSEAADVSAVSNGSQILQTVSCLIIGLTMGTTVLLGQKIGEGNSHEAGDVVGTSIYIFGTLAVTISVILIAFHKIILDLLNTPIEAYTKTAEYTIICGLGFIFISAYNVLCSIFRGIGDSKTPLMIVAIACGFNVVLDLVLVAVFSLDTIGVAIATTFAQAISVVISIVIIRKRGLPFEFTRKNIVYNKVFAKRMIALGLPIALQDTLIQSSFLFIGSIVNTFGVIASAGVGVARKLAGIVMMVPSSLAQTMAVFSAQNVGAKKYYRANKALKYALMTGVTASLFISYFAFFHGDILSRFFATDPDVIAASAEYLKAYAMDVLVTSSTFCMAGYLNGHGKTTFVMVQGLIGAFLVRVPVSYIMSMLDGATLFTIGIALPVSTFFQLILLTVMVVKLNVKLKHQGYQIR